jgi:hypothetical protein
MPVSGRTFFSKARHKRCYDILSLIISAIFLEPLALVRLQNFPDYPLRFAVGCDTISEERPGNTVPHRLLFNPDFPLNT